MRRHIRGGAFGTGRFPLALLFLVLAPPVALAHPQGVPARRDSAPGFDAAWQGMGIALLLRELDGAYRNGDLAAAAALIDFPLVVMAATPDGRALEIRLGPEEWLEAVEPAFNGEHRQPVRSASEIDLVTDSLAWIVDDRATLAQPASMKGERPSILSVRRSGKWLIKAIVGRGWPGAAGAATLARTLG